MISGDLTKNVPTLDGLRQLAGAVCCTPSHSFANGNEAHGSVLTQVIQKTEVLRNQLVQLVLQKDSFVDDDVLKLSQDLDQHIMLIQKKIGRVN
ncbi:aspartyl-phosphate phosphatase Spo0E family protein [Paenibacillus sp. 481]|uniref:aspartyl-phosphate phosphatase Spo0E family protein n=1 Tax=Paenibacillus sp. 481 TaxID=2835869 RepID=UPI001E44721E|nr:aspartyl-phosphate phosphatase Spo0E family protein [Paenibacillus sp. 481]UHA74561.1 aspartyl-phosphate phosphatase Spo0E family protein [Paenibacillus sp. 481]